MKFNSKKSQKLKSIASKLKIASSEIVDIAAKNSLSLWTSYADDWIKINPRDLHYIATKATNTLKLEGDYFTSSGKKISISSIFIDLGQRDDHLRPIDALSMMNNEFLKLEKILNATDSKTEGIENLDETEYLSKRGSGTHWTEKRERLLSAIIYQIDSGLNEEDPKIIKTQNNKRSLNMTGIAQRVVDHSQSMPQIKKFASSITTDRVKDIIREALGQ